MKANIFKIREQVAKGARKIVLKNFLVSLTRYILFAPFVFVIIVLLGIVFLLMFVLQKTIKGGSSFKELFNDFTLFKDALGYFSKDSIELIFYTYHCFFKCKVCGKECNYEARYIDTELPLWQWLDEAEQTCYECYEQEKRNENEQKT